MLREECPGPVSGPPLEDILTTIPFEAELWWEDGQFTARANPLDVMSCGATREEAKAALLEAVDLFLDAAADRGTLEEILIETGYSKTPQGGWTHRKPERFEMISRLQTCPA